MSRRKLCRRTLAEGVGFEPTIRFPVYTLSKRAPSATRPPLRKGRAPQGCAPQGCAHYSRGRRGGNPFATAGQVSITPIGGFWTLSMIFSENQPPPRIKPGAGLFGI